MFSDVPQGSSAHKGICYRMEEHIGIGMPVKSQIMRDFDAAKDELPAADQAVNIVAEAGSYCGTDRITLFQSG